MGEGVKSVHITNYYHPSSGGVKSNYDSLLQAADSYKRHVCLIVPGETDKVERVGKYGKIYFVKAKHAPFFDRRYRLMTPFHYLQTGTPIREILLQEMPDMIEIYDNYALTLLAGIIRKGYFKALGRPMLVYFTGERFDTIFKSFVSDGKLAHWFCRRLMGNYNLAMFDYFIANSSFVAEELFESVLKKFNPNRSERFFNFCWRFFNSSPKDFEERVVICPRGVDTKHFSPSRKSKDFQTKMRKRFGIPENARILLSSTRISPEKNIELLPEVMKILSSDGEDYRLLVAGAGPKKEWLLEKSKQLPQGKIILLGHLDKETLADYYANVDVFIHPNPREPFGNVVLEAMASGVSIVVPNSGGILSYANRENAWLTEPTPQAFAETIKAVFSNEELRESKIAKSLETASRNSKKKAIERLFETYDRIYCRFRLNFGKNASK